MVQNSLWSTGSSSGAQFFSGQIVEELQGKILTYISPMGSVQFPDEFLKVRFFSSVKNRKKGSIYDTSAAAELKLNKQKQIAR